ncbi:MAG: hypothetical protein ACQEVA_06790 [Myxococcota bacterium]
MSLWPLDFKYGVDRPLALEVYGEPLKLTPLDATTLEYSYGGDEDSKLVGVSSETNIIRLTLSVGSIPLLIFPRRGLLCPADSKLKTVMRLPLFIQVGVGTANDVKEIAEIRPISTSRALYGPVDAGVLCTSIHSDVGVTIDELQGSADAESKATSPAIATLSAGDDPEMADDTQLAPSLSESSLAAFARLTISNETHEPREVAKIMVPHDLLTLYDSDGVILTSHLKMLLQSETEAELDFGPCPDAEASAIPDLQGRARINDGRKHLFDLTYRNKTGLEYGF